MTEPSNEKLDKIDEILFKYSSYELQILGGEYLETPKSKMLSRREAKAQIQQLIKAAELKARIEELRFANKLWERHVGETHYKIDDRLATLTSELKSLEGQE